MIEYNIFLEEYASEAYLLYTNSISEKEWGDKKSAGEYLAKYYILNNDYLSCWKQIQNKIFINQDKGLPEIVFSDHFELLALGGGVLFVQEDFQYLQKCIQEIGDKQLIIVQNTFDKNTDVPPLRMRYPVDISWNELMSGNFISTVLFEMFHNEYFVFSESGNWGKYSANDYENPLDIIGFKPEYEAVFREQFKQTKEDEEEVKKWLPLNYKELIK